MTENYSAQKSGKALNLPPKVRLKIWLRFNHPLCKFIGHAWGREEEQGEITKRTCERCGIFELSIGKENEVRE